MLAYIHYAHIINSAQARKMKLKCFKVAMWKELLFESKLVMAMIILVIARCVDRVVYTCVDLCCIMSNTISYERHFFSRRITYDYRQFLWYFSNIICPLAFAMTSWPVVWYKLCFTSTLVNY